LVRVAGNNDLEYLQISKGKGSLTINITELPPYIYTIIAENPYPSMDTPLNFS
jgi:hypothetical protein